MSIRKTMFVKENSFRKLDDPFNDSTKKYVFYVKVGDVPEGIPMATNPRDQRLTSGVAQAIKESLESNDGYFHLKNRGIVISAKSCTYNNKTKEVTINFTDDMLHGNIDGGHTYKIVCDHRNDNLDQYVQFEVMTGVEDIIEQLAEARNTSVQVDEKSMAELKQKFDPIKEGLEGMSFYPRIAFKQNQQAFDDNTNKKLKMIDAREVVSIVNMFNIDKFDSVTHPIKAYSSKANMLDMYLKDRNITVSMLILCLIFLICMMRLKLNLQMHLTIQVVDMVVKNMQGIKMEKLLEHQNLDFKKLNTKFQMD